MGSIPSILVIVKHHSFSKSNKTLLAVRQFGKRTSVKRVKQAHNKVESVAKPKVQRALTSKRSVNLPSFTAARKWGTFQRKKHRTTKKVFLATRALSRKPQFYWVRGRLKILKLLCLKIFAKPKRYLVTFKNSPKSLTHYKTLLRSLSGKKRGRLLRKNISTAPRTRRRKLLTKQATPALTPSLHLKRKQKYNNTKHRLKFWRPILRRKPFQLRYRFKNIPTLRTAPFDLVTEHFRAPSQKNINLSYWKMYGVSKTPQQLRALAVYNDTNASSSFFLSKRSKPDNLPNTIPLFMVDHLSAIRRLVTQYTSVAVNNPSLNFHLTHITSGATVTQLSQIVNKTSVGLKRLREGVAVQPTWKRHSTELNLSLHSVATTIPTQYYSFRQWLYETAFIYRKFTLSKGAILVLSRVPPYKMDAFAPVNADRYRGNVHSKLGLVHDNSRHLTLKKKVPFLHLSHRSSFVSFLSQKVRFSRKLSSTVKKESLVHWQALSHKDPELRKLESFFVPENLILKYRPKLEASVTRNHRLRTKALLPRSRKSKLYNHVYDTSITKNSKKRPLRGKTRNVKFKARIDVRVRQGAKRRILKAYKALVASRDQQLNKIKKLRWWKLPKLYKSYRRLCKVRKFRRTSIRKLLGNSYRWPQNTHYSHEPSREQRKGEELLVAAPATTHNTLSAHVFESPLTTLLDKTNGVNLAYSNQSTLASLVWNVPLLKLHSLTHGKCVTLDDNSLIAVWRGLENFSGSLSYKSNLVPHSSFDKGMAKKVLNSFSNKSFQTDLVPWYYNTLIRFIEDCSGKKVLFQFYPFINQEMTADFVARYRRWLPRMSSYERNLGHRFFLEEALHIMHLSFILRDPKIIATWLKAMILRISFWKTRSIFRFLKYLFHNYFRHVFPDINIKGLKIRLKGKISAAGNSRKRTILYRIGKTSHSQTSLRVLSEFTTINTFTGVMGFSVWLFY